jgi:hypothetical protein
MEQVELEGSPGHLAEDEPGVGLDLFHPWNGENRRVAEQVRPRRLRLGWARVRQGELKCHEQRHQ